jgi:tRNA (guanosine-2'-O-)-methyltransferase
MMIKNIDYAKAIACLSEFALDKRFDLMQEKLRSRTLYLTVCLENIYHQQNASAVVRSMEAFGIQDVHVIENECTYRVNPDIALGSDKWLNLHKHNNLTTAIEQLRANDYRIVAAVPDATAVSLEKFDLAKGKTAILMGCELTGLSAAAIASADEYLYIPMCGFVESLNVSVAAAIIMYTLSTRLRNSSLPWQMPANEYNPILFQWLMKSIRSSDKILKRIFDL